MTLEEQLERLRPAGIALNPGIEIQDLLDHSSRQSFEKHPFRQLIQVLGMETERPPYPPLCDRLFMCDYERIEDHGSYRELLERLELMHGLGLQQIQDYVDIDQGQAWVSFVYRDQHHHWRARVDNDWLDESILDRYAELLKGQDLRLYANKRDFGQSSLLAVFTPAQFQVFRELSKFKMGPW